MGKAVAIQLAEKGANVVIVARDEGKLQHALQEITVSPSITHAVRIVTNRSNLVSG